MSEITATGPNTVILMLCPASIWLLGAAANCGKPAGHDGNHSVTIEWSVK